MEGSREGLVQNGSQGLCSNILNLIETAERTRKSRINHKCLSCVSGKVKCIFGKVIQFLSIGTPIIHYMNMSSVYNENHKPLN